MSWLRQLVVQARSPVPAIRPAIFRLPRFLPDSPAPPEAPVQHARTEAAGMSSVPRPRTLDMSEIEIARPQQARAESQPGAEPAAAPSPPRSTASPAATPAVELPRGAPLNRPVPTASPVAVPAGHEAHELARVPPAAPSVQRPREAPTIRPVPTGRPAPPAARPAAAPPAPDVHIHIGRIDITAAPTPAPRHEPKPQHKPMPLEEYLRGRSRGVR